MIYAFLDFELDQAAFELRKFGAPIDVQPKVLDLLVYLIEHREKVVTKEELFTALWKDVVVSETALTRLVKEARKAVDDDGDAQRVLSTTRGRGYRFVAPVTMRSREILPASAPVSAGAPDIDEPAPASRASTIVGREREVALIERAIAKARGGSGSLCLVHGERGIGKSRLLDEAGDLARGTGAIVVRARGTATPGHPQPPYRVWVDLLRAARRLVPESDALYGHVKVALAAFEALSSGEGGDRYRAIDATMDVLDAARARSMAILIDDLHAADAGTLDVLAACVGQIRDAKVVILGAYTDAAVRMDPAFASAIGNLSADGATRMIELRGLSAVEIGVLTERLGGKPGRADYLHAKTGGNPLLLMQFLRAAPVDDRSYSSVDVSDAIGTALAHVLAALSSEARELLRVASVFGTRFSLGALAAAADLPNETTLERLDEALRARLIEKVPRSIADYVFGRPILRDVAYGQLDEALRARLHTRVAEVLVAGGDRALEVALHFLKGAAAGDPERALVFARSAAEAAIARGQLLEASTVLDRALEVVPLLADSERHKVALVAALETARRSREAKGDPAPPRDERPIRAASGTTTTLDDGFAAGRELAEIVQAKLALGGVSAGLLFTSIRADIAAVARGVRSVLPIPLVGCTTYSEVSEAGYQEHSATLLVITGDRLAAGAGVGHALAADPARAAAEAWAAAQKSMTEPPKIAFVFPDGALSARGADCVEALKELAGDTLVVGGLPGDGGRFQQAFAIEGDHSASDAVVVLLLGGDDLAPQCITRSGWAPLGRRAIATRSEGGRLVTIDGKSATEYVEEYVSDIDDPEVIATHPLAIASDTLDVDGTPFFVIRSPFVREKESGAIVYQGPIPEGAQVQLMHGSRKKLLDGAKEAVSLLTRRYATRAPSAVLLFSCAGRKLLLGHLTHEEVATFRDALPGVPMAGFYCYGEIGAFDSSRPELAETRFHNCTLVAVAL